MLVTFCSPVNCYSQFGLLQAKCSPPFLTGGLTQLDETMKQQSNLRTQNTY
ncbi:hypothetical protein T4E_9716 [Trichinella pseudospiralis]|uniref:Uncharacterized protein n=1 Tax=Trichinella pseudospiralis TaxID=6337 RepID=A0A0V0XGI0_TRIPS|nr:hypothetical protein T4E_9716 [Trichinella pseudospiralis]